MINLWSYARDDGTTREVERTNHQLLVDCKITNDGVLRRAIRECEKEGYLKRIRVKGKRGFRLFHPALIAQRSPGTGLPGPEVSPDRSPQTGGGGLPGPVREVSPDLPSLGLTTGTLTTGTTTHGESDDGAVSANGSPNPACGAYSAPGIESKFEERWTPELETELLELQTQTYRTVGERLGKADLHDIVATPGTRQAIQARMLEGYTADMLRKAMRARGRAGGKNDFRYLGNASAWSAKAIEFALGIPDDEEAKRVPVAEADGFIPEL